MAGKLNLLDKIVELPKIPHLIQKRRVLLRVLATRTFVIQASAMNRLATGSNCNHFWVSFTDAHTRAESRPAIAKKVKES